MYDLQRLQSVLGAWLTGSMTERPNNTKHGTACKLCHLHHNQTPASALSSPFLKKMTPRSHELFSLMWDAAFVHDQKTRYRFNKCSTGNLASVGSCQRQFRAFSCGPCSLCTMVQPSCAAMCTSSFGASLPCRAPLMQPRQGHLGCTAPAGWLPLQQPRTDLLHCWHG